MDSFHVYLKKQLLDYVGAERKKGIPLEEIEKTLLDAGHQKNILDEVFSEIKDEEITGKKTSHKDPVENDLVSQLKNSFKGFLAKSSGKEVADAQKDLEKTDTNEVVQEVIEEAEVIEEKTMLESMVFFGYLFLVGLMIMFSAGGTDSPITNVAIGFLPAILSIFVSFLALGLADNVPLYMFIPLVISGVFYAVGKFLPFQLMSSLDMEPIAIVSFLVGFIFNIIIVYVRFIKPSHMKRRVIQRENRMQYKDEPSHAPITKAHLIRQRMEINELKKEFKL